MKKRVRAPERLSCEQHTQRLTFQSFMNRQIVRALLPALGVGLSVAASHGIGRFGYALLLPAMRESLGWTYLQASWMNTANAFGYIFGAVIGYVLLGRVRVTTLFPAGLLLTVCCVLLTGAASDFAWLFTMRLVSGIGTAWAFSCGGTLVTQMYVDDPKLRGYAGGVFFGCAGLGMVLTALTVAPMTELQGAGAWRAGWVALGAVSVLLAIWPIGSVSRMRSAGAAPAAAPQSQTSQKLNPWVEVSYFLFAVAHTPYIFFVFAWLRATQSDWRLGAAMWIVLGASIFASAFLWQHALSSWRATSTLALSCVVVAVGTALPLVHLTGATVVLSAVLVGSALFIVPAGAAALVRQDLAAPQWPRALMFLTIIFSLGQAVGSWAAGWLADRFSLSTSLVFGSAGLVMAAACAACGRIAFNRKMVAQ
jgi:predicted MFS family arabinose efflux permease